MINPSSLAEAFHRSEPRVRLLNRLDGPLSAPDAPPLGEVCRALWARPGKRLRSHLVYWFGDLVGIEPERLDLYAWAAEAIHTATLLHDDVIDRAEMRRGGASANRIFDNTLPVLAGDFLFSDAVHQVAVRGDPRLLTGLCEVLKSLASGECLQYELRFRIAENEQVYRTITRLKTSSLFAWAAKVGPTLAGGQLVGAVSRFVDDFGAFFQYADDILDLIGSPDKGRWTDLREGQLNFAAWHLAAACPDLRSWIAGDFAAGKVTTELISEFERNVEAPSVFGVVHAELNALKGHALASLAGLPLSPVTRALRELIVGN